MSAPSRKRKFSEIDTYDDAKWCRWYPDEPVASKSATLVNIYPNLVDPVEPISSNSQDMKLFGDLAKGGRTIVQFISHKLATDPEMPRKRRRVDPTPKKTEAISEAVSEFTTVIEVSEGSSDSTSDYEECLETANFPDDEEDELPVNNMKPSYSPANGRFIPPHLVGERSWPDEFHRTHKKHPKGFTEPQYQEHDNDKYARTNKHVEIMETYLETVQNLNDQIRSGKGVNETLQTRNRDLVHKHRKIERHLRDKMERLESELVAARSEIKKLKSARTKNDEPFGYGMDGKIQTELHELNEEVQYYRTKFKKLENEYTRMSKRLNTTSNQCVLYERQKVAHKKTISSLNNIILHLNSELGFYEEKDDTFVESGFAQLETGIRNWVTQNYKGVTELPFEVTVISVFRFQERSGKYDRKETSCLLKHHLMHEIYSKILDVVHCNLEEDILDGMLVLREKLPNGPKKSQWRAKTLRMFLKDKFDSSVAEERIRRLVDGIECAIGKYASPNSCEMLRREGLYRIVKDATVLSHEIKMLSKSEIMLEWPVYGQHFDPDKMETSTGEDARAGAVIDDPLFPEVIKSTYGENGDLIKFSLRKATVLMPSAKLKNEVSSVNTAFSSPKIETFGEKVLGETNI